VFKALNEGDPGAVKEAVAPRARPSYYELVLNDPEPGYTAPEFPDGGNCLLRVRAQSVEVQRIEGQLRDSGSPFKRLKGVAVSPEGPAAEHGRSWARGGGVQMGRTGNMIVLTVYLLTVPAGVFFSFTSPGLGYPKSTAGIIAGVLALAGLALIPVALRNKPADPDTPAEASPAKTGWAVLIGFLVVVAAVVAYFTLKDE
jgi:hypothetical protein